MVSGGVTLTAVDLQPRFERLWRRLGAAGTGEATFARLMKAYSEPHRAYHTAEHLTDCLTELDQAPASGTEREQVEAAIWFHDVVYDTHAADNEAQSAAWATSALSGAGVALPVIDAIRSLILQTRHVSPASDAAGGLLCDIDLSILGRTPEEFDAFERRIRAEYGWVPEREYRTGRTQVLSRIVGWDQIYQTEHFHRRYEAAARRNLSRIVAQLRNAVTQ
jgi:predicted metal-dependent HD superfamily phosphohydrolase